MANFQDLKDSISAVITSNGTNDITGSLLDQILNSMVDILGANAGAKWIDAMVNSDHIFPTSVQDVAMVTNELLLENGTTVNNSFFKTTGLLTNSHASVYDFYSADFSAFNSGFANVVFYDASLNKIKDYILTGKKVIGVPPNHSIRVSLPNSRTLDKILTYDYKNDKLSEIQNLQSGNYQNWVDVDNSTNLTNADTLLALKAIKMLHVEIDPSIASNTLRINTFCGSGPALGSNYADLIEIRDESESPLIHFRLESIFSKDSIDILVGESADGLRKGVAVVDWSLLPSDTFQFFGQSLLRIKKNFFNPIASIAKDVYDLKINAGIGSDKKKILAIGTSITQGCTYVQNAAQANNYIAYNKGIGSSGIVLNSGVLGNGRDGLDLSETIAEKEIRYAGSGSLETYRNASWERVIKPYLDGTIDEVDAIWFDHGYNDRGSIYSELATLGSVNWEPDNTADRTTFTGAFRYLLWQIFNLKPTIKIIIGGYMEDQSDNSVRAGAGIRLMHEEISKQYGFHLMPTWEHSGFNFKHVPNSSNYISDFNTAHGTNYNKYFPDANGNITFFQLYNPDTVHPYSDLTGKADAILDKAFTKMLKNLV